MTIHSKLVIRFVSVVFGAATLLLASLRGRFEGGEIVRLKCGDERMFLKTRRKASPLNFYAVI